MIVAFLFNPSMHTHASFHQQQSMRETGGLLKKAAATRLRKRERKKERKTIKSCG